MRQEDEVVGPDRDLVVFSQTSLGSEPHDFHMQILGKARGSKCASMSIALISNAV